MFADSWAMINLQNVESAINGHVQSTYIKAFVGLVQNIYRNDIEIQRIGF